MFERWRRHPDSESDRSALFGKPIPEARGAISPEDRRDMATHMAERIREGNILAEELSRVETPADMFPDEIEGDA